MNIIGHTSQKQHMAQQLKKHHLSHATLLHGPSGIGKSLFAHTIAAAFLCEASTPWACEQCSSCHMLQAQSHPDFLGLGRAYNDKNVLNRDVNISQTRSLLHFIGLTGTRSQKRVVILDDADRLNHQAANALLKGLEEPPEGCLILLVCENIQRLPITVRSRCLLMPFGSLDHEACQQIFINMGIQPEYMHLAHQIANGQPGKVIEMCEDKKAQALLSLSQLVQQPLDILAWQTWLDRHLSSLTASTVVDVIRSPYMKTLLQLKAFEPHHKLCQALWDLACWPERLRQHSLRPAPSLLAHILHLHHALEKA